MNIMKSALEFMMPKAGSQVESVIASAQKNPELIQLWMDVKDGKIDASKVSKEKLEQLGGIDSIQNSPEGQEIIKERMENEVGLIEKVFDSKGFGIVKNIVSWISPKWRRKIDQFAVSGVFLEDIYMNYKQGDTWLDAVMGSVWENTNSSDEAISLLSATVGLIPSKFAGLKSTMLEVVEWINKLKPIIPNIKWGDGKKEIPKNVTFDKLKDILSSKLEQKIAA